MWGSLPHKRREKTGKKLWQIRQPLLFFHTKVQLEDSGLTSAALCDRDESQRERASERGNHGVAGVFMGGVKVSVPGRAVIVGDTLIKMFWEGFSRGYSLWVADYPSHTNSHRCVCPCVRVCLCLLTRVNVGETDSSCPLARLWQACLKSSKIDCFFSFGLCLVIAFFQHIFAAPDVTTTILWNSKLYFHMTKCLSLSLLQSSTQAQTLLTELLTQKLPEWFFFFPNLKLFRQMQFIPRYNCQTLFLYYD